MGATAAKRSKGAAATKVDPRISKWVTTLGADSRAAENPVSWPPFNEGHCYDFDLATITAYSVVGSDGAPHARFPQRYKDARGKLDYGYHPDMFPARQMLQDAIVSRCEVSRESTLPGEQPWIVFTAGAMGVGKSYVMLTLDSDGLFPMENFALVDPDKLKNELPEMKGYLERDPATAATKVHRESTMISEVLFEHCLSAKQNLLVDGSLRDVGWYTKLFQRIRREFPVYRIGIVHITASRETIINRAEARAKETGRVVPRELLEASMAQVPESVAALAPLADFVADVANDDGSPLVLQELKAPGRPPGAPPSWEAFAEPFRRPWHHPLLDSVRQVLTAGSSVLRIGRWLSSKSSSAAAHVPTTAPDIEGGGTPDMKPSVSKLPMLARPTRRRCCGGRRRMFSGHTHDVGLYLSAMRNYNQRFGNTCLRCAVQDHAELGAPCMCLLCVPPEEERKVRRFRMVEPYIVGLLFRVGWYDSAPPSWKSCPPSAGATDASLIGKHVAGAV
mmetsp:Transcript_68329/g.192688  ORF Transcript_68329/g.192688 Transcript_68329/m.192688 type:complete len:506 (-) Transcript_68329:228-1745(-)